MSLKEGRSVHCEFKVVLDFLHYNSGVIMLVQVPLIVYLITCPTSICVVLHLAL